MIAGGVPVLPQRHLSRRRGGGGTERRGLERVPEDGSCRCRSLGGRVFDDVALAAAAVAQTFQPTRRGIAEARLDAPRISPISPLRQRGPEWTIGWPTLGLRNQAEEEQMAVCLVIKIPGGTRRYLGAGHKPAH
jgi:hypothetical protein